MYRFTLTAITKKSGLSVKRIQVFAPDLKTATELAEKDLWWDCYQPHEVALNFTGKTRI